MKSLWERTQASLRKKISEEIFSKYFEQATIIALQNNRATIRLPFNVDPKEATPYKSLLELCWQEVNGTSNRLDFEFRDTDDNEPVTKENTFLQAVETTSIPLSKNYTFDNFVPGDKAQLAYNAAFAVAENPKSNKYNPLFIYGSPGLGKTHLLQAIGNYVIENDPTMRVHYLTAHDFQEQYIRSVREKKSSELSAFYRTIDVLLIDDIQNWSGMEETQNEFFHIFNALYQMGKQIVLTSDVPAIEVKSLAERLVSRFSWGLTADIQPPNLETRTAILRQKTKDQHIIVSDDVIAYLAENITGNVRFLESALTKLTVQASIDHHDIDLSLARKVVVNILPTVRKKINVQTIIKAVAEYYDISVEKLVESGRGIQEVSAARQIAMYFTREFSSLSLKGIGLHFGGRDHATVIHAIDAVKKKIAEDPSFESEIETLKSTICE